MFEECLCGVSKGDMYVDDIQLPPLVDQFICCQAAFYAQVVVDVYLDVIFVGYGQSIDPCGALLVPCRGEDGGSTGVGCLGFEGLFLPPHGFWVAPRHDWHVLQVWSFGSFVQGAWLVEGHESDNGIGYFVGVRLGAPWWAPCAAWYQSLSQAQFEVDHCCQP